MSLLSDADVASMRATLEESLPDTAVVQTPSYVDNLGGGGTLAWTASGTYDARIGPVGGRSAYGDERVIANRAAENADWVITLPAGTPVDTDDRILLSGKTYNVVAFKRWSQAMSLRIEVNEAV